MAYDIDIDAVKAKKWVWDVNNEIERAEEILNKILRETQTDPGENDTIFQGLEATSQKLGGLWNAMCKCYHDVGGYLSDIIEKVTSTVSDIGDDIETMKGKIGTNN